MVNYQPNFKNITFTVTQINEIMRDIIFYLCGIDTKEDSFRKFYELIKSIIPEHVVNYNIEKRNMDYIKDKITKQLKATNLPILTDEIKLLKLIHEPIMEYHQNYLIKDMGNIHSY